MVPTLAPEEAHNDIKRSAASRFFGVVADLRAYAALLYAFLSLVTGIVYFTWVVTGLSLSAGLIVLIIGFPFLTLFLMSVRGIALIEGRLIEAVLGIRMPRRTVFFYRNLGLWERIKTLFSDRTTWTAVAYMVLLLPLGILYFSIFICLIGLSLVMILRPVMEYVFDIPFISTDGFDFYTPSWLMPVAMLIGVLVFILTLHLAKQIGRLQGKFAKVMLVKQD